MLTVADKPIERRLAAILAADVVGYSRLMAANEERTMGALRQHRREFFDPTVARHGGRLFKAMGDGFLVEFASVLNAARCAVEIQRGMPERNSGVPEDRHIKFRIGINLGDVIVEGEDVYGEGVNMASRLEGLATPGGIACSATVRSHIGNKLDLEFLDQGEKTVKNIDEPVHVYFIGLAGLMPTRLEQSRPQLTSEKPSIAVLPFANISADPEQEFFADGITEDIITDLSKVSGLFIISRNTVFTLKGKATNLQETAKRLGVSYLVEGSVRKSGNRVRITAQLIEGSTDTHLWAERFDRDLTDIFAIQDEITKAIVDQLKVRLLPEEQKAIGQAPTGNVEAYTSYLRGKQIFRAGTRSSLVNAKRAFARALELDPSYALAYVGLATCDSYLKSFHGEEVQVSDILETIGKGLAINANLAEAHAARGIALGVDDRRLEAEQAFETALRLDPNCYEARYHYARYFNGIGEFEKALPHYMRAMEIQPDDPESVCFLATSLWSLGRRDESRKYLQIGVGRVEKALQLYPDNSRPAQLLAVALAYRGERENAKYWLEQLFEIEPNDNQIRYNAACAYSVMGESDKALDLLETWVQHVARDSKLWFTNDPDFDNIRGHPRYQKLLELVR